MEDQGGQSNHMEEDGQDTCSQEGLASKLEKYFSKIFHFYCDSLRPGRDFFFSSPFFFFFSFSFPCFISSNRRARRIKNKGDLIFQFDYQSVMPNECET